MVVYFEFIKNFYIMTRLLRIATYFACHYYESYTYSTYLISDTAGIELNRLPFKQ